MSPVNSSRRGPRLGRDRDICTGIGTKSPFNASRAGEPQASPPGRGHAARATSYGKRRKAHPYGRRNPHRTTHSAPPKKPKRTRQPTGSGQRRAPGAGAETARGRGSWRGWFDRTQGHTGCRSRGRRDPDRMHDLTDQAQRTTSTPQPDHDNRAKRTLTPTRQTRNTHRLQVAQTQPFFRVRPGHVD